MHGEYGQRRQTGGVSRIEALERSMCGEGCICMSQMGFEKVNREKPMKGCVNGMMIRDRGTVHAIGVTPPLTHSPTHPQPTG
jgi:hypothetical protein